MDAFVRSTCGHPFTIVDIHSLSKVAPRYTFLSYQFKFIVMFHGYPYIEKVFAFVRLKSHLH
jgi:hypothetical protein